MFFIQIKDNIWRIYWLSYYFCHISLTAELEMPYLFTFREILNLAIEFGRPLPRKHLIPRYFNIDRYARQKYGLISMCILSFNTSTTNYVSISNPRWRQVLLETINLHNLKDAFRYFHPNIQRYTWRHKNPIKQARLDYFIVSDALTDLSECTFWTMHISISFSSLVEIGQKVSTLKRLVLPCYQLSPGTNYRQTKFK